MESALDNVELDVAVDTDSMAVVADAEGKQLSEDSTIVWIRLCADKLQLFEKDAIHTSHLYFFLTSIFFKYSFICRRTVLLASLTIS
jgi:hypothetical protein